MRSMARWHKRWKVVSMNSRTTRNSGSEFLKQRVPFFVLAQILKKLQQATARPWRPGRVVSAELPGGKEQNHSSPQLREQPSPVDVKFHCPVTSLSLRLKPSLGFQRSSDHSLQPQVVCSGYQGHLAWPQQWS